VSHSVPAGTSLQTNLETKCTHLSVVIGLVGDEIDEVRVWRLVLASLFL